MKRLAAGVAILLSLSGAIAATAPGPVSIGPLGPAGAPASAFPNPERPVAGIVASQWSTEEARDRNREAARVMHILGIRRGMSVADIGAGSGYYTVRVARKVGPSGHVIAEDVTADYLATLEQRLADEHLDNVALDLGEPHDPRLPRHSVDRVLMVHMYHEVEQPYGLLYNLLPALRRGARVAVVDLERPTGEHGTPRRTLLCEFRALGFREIGWHWLLGRDEYLAVFAPPAHPIAPDRIKPCAS